MPRLWASALIGIILLVPSSAVAQLVGTGFTQPVYAAPNPLAANSMYVVQRGGLVRSLNLTNGSIGSTPLLNMSTVTGSSFTAAGGEQGLLGLAFHPNFATNRQMYVSYTYDNGQTGGAVRVDQFTVNAGGTADVASRRTVIDYDDRRFTNHNAGWIGFNPVAPGSSAYNLYIPSGDGGSGNDPDNNAQNLGVYTGKLLRVNVGSAGISTNGGYTIPTGNMTGTGVRPEIYSYGLRNPYRASFDRTTGNLYIGDVGQSAREEIDFIPNGAAGGQNFGWRLREGDIQNPDAGAGGPEPPGYVPPIHAYPRSRGASVTGGYVYRGPALDAGGQPLDGTYIFGDFVSGRIWSFRYTGTFVPTGDTTERTTEFGFTAGELDISSFAQDADGALYVIHYGGSIYRIVPVPEPATVGLVVGALVGVRALARIRARSTRRTA